LRELAIATTFLNGFHIAEVFAVMKKAVLFTWSILRLPLLGLLFFLFRSQISTLFERTLQLTTVIDFAVYSLSTFSTRFYLFLVLVTALFIAHGVIGKFTKSAQGRYALFLATAGAVVFIVFQFFFLVSNAWMRALVVAAFLAINSLPRDWVSRLVSSNRAIDALFIAGIGFVEALFPQTYFLWLHEQFKRSDTQTMKADPSWGIGVFSAAILAIFLLTPFNNQRILTLGEMIHADPAVMKFAEGEYNWIELNPERRELYAVGYYSNFIMIFNTDELKAPPRKSKTSIDGTQSFGFNPDLQQVYVYNHMAQELVYLDAPDLSLSRTLPITDLSNGDVWVKWDQKTDTITLSSEADLNVGTPFYLLDRQSGEVRATMSLPVIPTAYIVFHPQKPVLYFNSFKDTYLVAWDMEKHQIIQQTQTSPRTDRMALSPKASELLVASPMEGAILRYDLETLEFKGKINTIFGDRTLAIDSENNLLFTGNFINNRLTVFDLNTFRVIRSYYLGPWIRTITLDTENKIAYVSTVRNLFKVDYAKP
jgi:DNA-binding beta-propeller fold protein YncE